MLIFLTMRWPIPATTPNMAIPAHSSIWFVAEEPIGTPPKKGPNEGTTTETPAEAMIWP